MPFATHRRVVNTQSCSQCGTALPDGAQFCPKCGKPVPVAAPAPPPPPAPVAAPPAESVAPPPAPPPAAAAEPAHGRSALVWIIPLALLVIAAIIFLVLAGAPYGRDDEVKVAPRAETETIAEGESAATATLVEAGEPSSTTATMPPPVLREDPPPSVIGGPIATPPQQQPIETRPIETRPVPPPQRPVETTPAPPPPRESGEISSEEAVNILRGFVTSRDYYGIGARCTSIRGGTYRNVGYTLEVHDSCSNRLLGLWRVDAKTREVFRQQEDGRFLRP